MNGLLGGIAVAVVLVWASTPVAPAPVAPVAPVAPDAPGHRTALVAPGAPVAPDQQHTGAIRGRLDIRRVARAPERRPDASEPGAPGPRDLPDLRRGVVYLETAPRGAFEERDLARAVMDQRNETFAPHVLAVMAGTVVDFPNSDKTYHNVFSLSKAKRFDLGRYAAGHSKSVRFDRPGVVRVFCDIHAHMNAFILVFTHPFFDVTDTDGRFQLGGVPPGAYTVVGWYEGEARVTRPVTVVAGTIVDLELLVP